MSYKIRKAKSEKLFPALMIEEKMQNLNFAQHSKMLPYMVYLLIYESDNECHQYSLPKGLDRQR